MVLMRFIVCSPPLLGAMDSRNSPFMAGAANRPRARATRIGFWLAPCGELACGRGRNARWRPPTGSPNRRHSGPRAV